MDFLEVIPGRNIGKLHVLKKVGNLNGEECFLCRDERGRNIQFVESDIIGQAGEVVPGEAPEVVEEEVVEETPSTDEKQDKEETPEGGSGSEPEEEVPGGASVEMTEGKEEAEPKDTSEGNPEKEKSEEEPKEGPKTSTFKKVVGKITGKGGK